MRPLRWGDYPGSFGGVTLTMWTLKSKIPFSDFLKWGDSSQEGLLPPPLALKMAVGVTYQRTWKRVRNWKIQGNGFSLIYPTWYNLTEIWVLPRWAFGPVTEPEDAKYVRFDLQVYGKLVQQWSRQQWTPATLRWAFLALPFQLFPAKLYLIDLSRVIPV